MNIKPIKISFNEWGAIITWLTVFVITLIAMNNSSWEVKLGLYQVIALFIIYLFCLTLVINESLEAQVRKLRTGLFILQLLCAFLINFYISFGFLPILTILWASILPHFVNVRTSFFITSLVVILWNLIDWILWENEGIIYSALLYYTFHIFAVSMTVNAITAEKEKERAEELNKQLESTQLLLNEASRQNERTRIARDLHDLLGHHLTALLINLQVAEHTSQGDAKENIIKCHSLAKLLMSDVREAVSSLRENQLLNFEYMLDKMIGAVPSLTFNIDIQYDFELDDIDIAKQLLNCIQEAITNSLKHSHAKQFFITISKNKKNLLVLMKDDGSSENPLTIGHGLTGIAERIQILGGKADFNTSSGALEIDICIPENRE
ncbi:MAG: two-component system sensor histidine kinase DesK [Polaribacter sp.]|jgi:two-component system sensor histidine kinase DesK